MVQSKKHTQKIWRDKSDKSFYLGNICNMHVEFKNIVWKFDNDKGEKSLNHLQLENSCSEDSFYVVFIWVQYAIMNVQ